MKLHIDGHRSENGLLSLTGWAVPENGNARLSYAVLKNGVEETEVTLRFRRRPDISTEFLADPYREDAGFYLAFPCTRRDRAVLTVTETEDGAVTDRRSFPVSFSAFRKKDRLQALKRRLEAPSAFARKVKNKLLHTEAKAYHEWFLKQSAGESVSLPSAGTVRFSVVVPVYRTPERLLTEMAESVLDNTFPDFELLLANASGPDETLENALKSLEEKDSRVKVLTLKENGGIARNTNEAAKAAAGEFIAFLDHDDLLTKDALASFDEALRTHPDADVLYSDEDKVTDDSSCFYDPDFKPEFDPILLLESQYVCHFTAVRASVFRAVGGLDGAYDGAQDHDLMLRIAETTDRFVHVPKVLYHWRSTPESTASGRDKKDYAENAGVRAVNRHLERRNLPLSVTKGPEEGRYLLQADLRDTPRISVLLPNRDHREDLGRIVRSLYETATYRNLEVLVLENGSREPETFELYESLKIRYPSLRVLKAEKGPFNYAKLNNDAVREATGEFLLLLNNDTEVLTPDFLERMAALSMIPGVGAVGAKLLYPDRTVQHAGIVTGEGGIAFHPFKGAAEDAPGYMCRAVTTMSVSAVTGACLLVRKAAYEAVGGMDERLAVAMNDVDLCFKLRASGLRTAVCMEAKLLHFESRSRGNEETEEKFVRYGEELRYFAEKWRGSPLLPDPCYPGVFSLLYGYQRKSLL